MLNPISHNVIRQALSWANIRPLSIRTLLASKLDNGAETALYELALSDLLLKGRHFVDDPNYQEYYFDFVRDLLQQCFCDDVRVGAMFYRSWENRLFVQLYIELSPANKTAEADLAWLID